MHWLGGARALSADVVQPNPLAGPPSGSAGHEPVAGGSVVEHTFDPAIAWLQKRSVEYWALTQ